MTKYLRKLRRLGMAKKSKETLSILDHLRKDIPDAPLDESDELAEEEEEEEEEELPPMIPPTEITGGY
jgi:hypothetical protein